MHKGVFLFSFNVNITSSSPNCTNFSLFGLKVTLSCKIKGTPDIVSNILTISS